MQIKTTMSYHLIPVRMPNINKSANNKRWRGYGEKGALLHFWWECKLVQPLRKTVWRYLRKLNIELPYDPAIPLWGIYLDKTFIEKFTYTPMFIAALFTIAKTWKQPKCPSTEEWFEKKQYKFYTYIYIDTHTHNGIFLSYKKDKLMPFAATWLDLETLILSEISRKEKDKYRIITLNCRI